MPEHLIANIYPWNEKISSSSKKYLYLYLIINISFVLILQAFLMGIIFFVPAKAQILNPNQNNEVKSLDSDEILNIVNQKRIEYNLGILTKNENLQAAAQAKADYLMAEQLFSHTGKNGEPFSTWVKQYNYKYIRIGENLAIFFENNEKIVQAWLNSENHRKNILNPDYKETGLAISYGQYHNKPTFIVVQIFGQPGK